MRKKSENEKALLQVMQAVKTVETTKVIERSLWATKEGRRHAAALLRLAAEAIGPVSILVKRTARHEFFVHSGMLNTAAAVLEKGLKT